MIKFMMFLIVTLGAFGSSARGDGASSVGCAELRSIARTAWLADLLGEDSSREDLDIIRQAERTLCSRFATPVRGSTIRYPNGRVATHSADVVGATWYYANGRTVTSSVGVTGATYYYPNGRRITASMGVDGATWYYANGRVISSSMGVTGATYYYPNGRRITSSAGVVGATWYYPNGRVISSSMGVHGAIWYYPNGRVWFTDGPEVSAAELTEVLNFISRILRDAGHEGI